MLQRLSKKYRNSLIKGIINMKRFFVIIILVSTVSSLATACFDTYLFLRRGSMVYPRAGFVVDMAGEYSFNKINAPGTDMFFSAVGVTYGVWDRFSLQGTFGTSERERTALTVDAFGIRGVYNILSASDYAHSVDLIMEYSSAYGGLDRSIELSLPNIVRMTETVIVLHPTMAVGFSSEEVDLGGHAGFFRTFDDRSIIGVGLEYSGALLRGQSTGAITRSEASASLFLGAQIGSLIYLQNEFAKGLQNTRDYGVAMTAKVIL